MSSLFQLPTWGPMQQCNKPSYCCIRKQNLLQNLFPSPRQVEEKVFALAALLCHSRPWTVYIHFIHVNMTIHFHSLVNQQHHHFPVAFGDHGNFSSVQEVQNLNILFDELFPHSWIFDVLWNMSMFRTFHQVLHKNIIIRWRIFVFRRLFSEKLAHGSQQPQVLRAAWLPPSCCSVWMFHSLSGCGRITDRAPSSYEVLPSPVTSSAMRHHADAAVVRTTCSGSRSWRFPLTFNLWIPAGLTWATLDVFCHLWSPGF